MPKIMAADDLEANTETVTLTGRRVEVWRMLELILRGWGVPSYTSTLKLTGSQKWDDNTEGGNEKRGWLRQAA